MFVDTAIVHRYLLVVVERDCVCGHCDSTSVPTGGSGA